MSADMQGKVVLVTGAARGLGAASKAGVEAFAHAVTGEVRHLGVGVGVAYLTWTDSDMTRGIATEPALHAAHRKMPWPVNRVYPAEPAYAKLADGIARRRAKD